MHYVCLIESWRAYAVFRPVSEGPRQKPNPGGKGCLRAGSTLVTGFPIVHWQQESLP